MLNPCYGDRVCYVTVNHKHDIDGSGGRAHFVIGRIEKLRTLAEVRDFVLKTRHFQFKENNSRRAFIKL